MNVKYPLLVLGLVSVLSSLRAAPGGAAYTYEPARSSVLVMAAEVTVDGDERANLGRSFTDSISRGLLKSRYFRVIDHLSNEQIAAESVKAASLPPERNAVRYGRLTNAEFVFIPRMVADDHHHVMTIKKVHVSTGELQEIYQASGEGIERGLMFRLCQQCLEEILTDSSREHSRKLAEARRRSKGEPTRPSIIDLSEVEPPAPSLDVSGEEPVLQAIPTPSGRVVVERERKTPVIIELEEKNEKAARIAGRVTSVNASWGFAVFSIDAKAKLRVNDKLFVTLKDPLIGIAKLDVVKIEGRQAIADFSEDIDTSLVRPGSRIYFAE
ncbi:MAG: hypothetical protein AAGJ79_07105 [Verrucomicrobiota bacterium]